LLKKEEQELRFGTVPHSCNPSYLGGGEREDHSSRPAWAKVCDTPINQQKLGIVAHSCHHRYTGSVNKRITVKASLGINARPYSKIPKAKKVKRMAQIVECLPSHHKALNSNPKVKKKEKEKSTN
jgi:hypothetical protein